MNRFSQDVIRKLGYYVYVYVDPRSDEVFYVGKGRANRAFSHLQDTAEHDKARRIRQIQKAGLEPKIEILTHGLASEKAAYQIEAAVIDLLGAGRLTNTVRGWGSGKYGRMKSTKSRPTMGPKKSP